MTSESIRSRRAVLAAAAGAVAASAASAVASPLVVQAAGNDGQTIHVGDNIKDVRSTTNLKNVTNDKSVMQVQSTQGGIGLRAVAESESGLLGVNHAVDRAAIEGTNSIGCGVLGFSGPSRPGSVPKGTGVYGRSEVGKGNGVIGEATSTSSEVYGVEGLVSSPLGRGVFGWSLNETAGGTGVWGQADSPDGVGVKGYAWHGFNESTKYGTGVMGFSGSDKLPPKALRNTGVYGIGVGGRGGVFQGAVGVYGIGVGSRGGIFVGPKAQVRLTPGSTDTHPDKGLSGDLFVDKKNRLWFCKGGSDWVRLDK